MALEIIEVANNEREYYIGDNLEHRIVPANVVEVYANGHELALIQAYFRETIPMPEIPAQNFEYQSGCAMPVRHMTWYGDIAKSIAYVWRTIICPEHRKNAQPS